MSSFSKPTRFPIHLSGEDFSLLKYSPICKTGVEKDSIRLHTNYNRNFYRNKLPVYKFSNKHARARKAIFAIHVRTLSATSCFLLARSSALIFSDSRLYLDTGRRRKNCDGVSGTQQKGALTWCACDEEARDGATSDDEH